MVKFIRHADAGYEKAIEFAEKNHVNIPMKQRLETNDVVDEFDAIFVAHYRKMWVSNKSNYPSRRRRRQ